MTENTLAEPEKKALDDISPDEWHALLQKIFGGISEDPKCAPILEDIGHVHFQLEILDRPDLSYWEEYLGDRVIPHLGTAETCHVVASTTFPVFIGTLLRHISIMEAAADESWELRGDTAALMRCANLLPFAMEAFGQAIPEQFATLEGDPL